MSSVSPLVPFLLMVVSGWVHRRQLVVIEFLQAENRLLKEKLGSKRLRFTDAERALLVRKASAVGRKALLQLSMVVSPARTTRSGIAGGTVRVGVVGNPSVVRYSPT